MWLDERTSKKWRSDSLEARIYASAEASALAGGYTEQEAAFEGMEAVFRVMGWLYSKPYGVVRQMVEDGHGVETSEAALSGFWQRFSSPFLQERLRRSAALARNLGGELDREGVQSATVDLITQKAFEIMSSPDGDPGEVVRLTKLILQSQKQELDARKVALLEEKAKAAERAKAELDAITKEAKDRGGLSEETLKRIEEAAGLL